MGVFKMTCESVERSLDVICRARMIAAVVVASGLLTELSYESTWLKSIECMGRIGFAAVLVRSNPIDVS